MRGGYRKPLKRPCSRCERYFQPATSGSKLCNSCFNEAKVGRFKSRRKT